MNGLRNIKIDIDKTMNTSCDDFFINKEVRNNHIDGSTLLLPRAERIIEQLKGLSPYVEKTLIYQYIGLRNKPESSVFQDLPNLSSHVKDRRKPIKEINL